MYVLYVILCILTCTVYTLTFVGLNFFCESVAICKIFIPQKFRPDGQQVCGYVTNYENINAKIAKNWQSVKV